MILMVIKAIRDTLALKEKVRGGNEKTNKVSKKV